MRELDWKRLYIDMSDSAEARSKHLIQTEF